MKNTLVDLFLQPFTRGQTHHHDDLFRNLRHWQLGGPLLPSFMRGQTHHFNGLFQNPRPEHHGSPLLHSFRRARPLHIDNPFPALVEARRSAVAHAGPTSRFVVALFAHSTSRQTAPVQTTTAAIGRCDVPSPTMTCRRSHMPNCWNVHLHPQTGATRTLDP